MNAAAVPGKPNGWLNFRWEVASAKQYCHILFEKSGAKASPIGQRDLQLRERLAVGYPIVYQ